MSAYFISKEFLFVFIFFISVTSFVVASPSVFPHGVTIFNATETYSGFTLFTPLGGDDSMDGKGVMYLIDMSGNVVHRWNLSYRPMPYGFLLPNGNLMYSGETESGPRPNAGKSGIIQEIDWDGNVIREFREDAMHNDFDKMPNGNILAIVWEKPPIKISGNIKGGIPGTEFNGSIWSDKIIEIDPNGKIVWEWHSYNHLDLDEFVISPLEKRNEWLHANSIDFLPKGNAFNGHESILISFKKISRVVIIDKTTKNLSWVWGENHLNQQHDATLLSSGNVLVFDNGMRIVGELPHSRVLEIDTKTDEIIWSYVGTGFIGNNFFSSILSGAQKLPNQNVLIAEGVTGRIFEVTPNKQIVWEYINPYYSKNEFKNAIFRAYRYGPNDIEWPVKMPSPNKNLVEKTITKIILITAFVVLLLIFIVDYFRRKK